MILYCVSEYHNAKDHFQPGDVIEVSPDKAKWLLNDSPGSFSKSKPKAKAPDKPAKDKAVKRSSVSKKSTR